MLFSSIRYFVFFAVVLLVYWRGPGSWRRGVLLVASYLFYMNWLPSFGLLILAQTTLNYGAGLLLARQRDRHHLLLAIAVAANVAVLAFFKYSAFIAENLAAVAGVLGTPGAFSFEYTVILPLGISFFTFEFIHYLVDVSRGHPPVRSWVDFALFPSFFPTQIAGPIKRYQSFVPQVHLEKTFDRDAAAAAVHLVVRGLFKKVVLANNLAVVADAGFGGVGALGAIDSWVVVIAYTMQIYFDFSGYTDIGRGSAALLGYDVPENFAWPYLSRNISEFWRRWHISLSQWLRDYVYIPLGGSRCSRPRHYLNLIATMTIGGLWHGAAWHFAIWGLFHGVGLVVHQEWKRRRGAPALASASAPALVSGAAPALVSGSAPPHASGSGTAWSPASAGFAPASVLAVGATLLFVVVGWVLFRAVTMADAYQMLSTMFVVGAPALVGTLEPDHWVTTSVIVLLYAVYLRLATRKTRERAEVTADPAWAWRTVATACMLAMTAAFPGGEATFIYFQF
jgi:alginate O-acetyltransferase complex protein AlgI